MAAETVLVPIDRSPTLRETVEYAVESALEASAASDDARADATDDESPEGTDERPTVHFVFVHAPREFDPDEAAPELEAAEELLDRAAVWAEEDAGGEGVVDVHTEHRGTREYLFSPADVARAVVAAAADADAGRIVLDPEYDPGVGAPFLRPLESELRGADPTVETAPVQKRVRRPPIVRALSARRVGAIAGLSFLFYQVLGGSLAPFDLVTGAVTATIVAVALSRISIGRDPSLRRTPMRAVRGLLYVPYLLWEVLKANVVVAAVILNPRAEVDPRMTRIEPAVFGALPVTSLANSITLTPGTLTVRVEGNELLVHTLLPESREDLFDGGLERAIRFVFYGRRAARIDSLADRDAAELVDADEVAAGVADDVGSASTDDVVDGVGDGGDGA